MSWIFKPWLLVTIGILFNIAAAVVTHYFIGLNNQQLETLGHKISNYETLISSQWRMKTELDRAEEFLLILLTIGQRESLPLEEKADQIIRKKLVEIGQQHGLQIPGKKLKYGTITNQLKLARQKIINSINDTYLEKISIENKQSPLKQNNSLLLSIAIFLQVTGLILVLSRDIKK